jgi:DNA-binding SARP family transcriptional activator
MDRWCRVTVLGELQLLHDDAPLPLLPSAERLLALMTVAHRGRRVRRLAVAERLWPDAAPGRAGSSLRSVLWRLPRPRGRSPVQSNATMLWLADGVDVDLWEAELAARRIGAVDAGRAAAGGTVETAADEDHCAAADALTLWSSDLLPHWVDDWLVTEQESFRQTRLHALETAALRLCHLGRYADALGAALAAVRSEPLRESAHRRVVEVHLAEGNHAEALRQYDGYRRLIAAELGLPPSDGIRRLVAPLLGRPVDLRPGA